MAKTVLIVDDVLFVRRTLVEIFNQSQYQVIGEASHGAEAIQLFEKLRPDLITMDLVMPHLSGIDAARRIIQIDKRARIIMISAMGQEHLVMEAINIGARDYVLKPFTAKDILKSAERALLDDDYVVNRNTAAPKVKMTP